MHSLVSEQSDSGDQIHLPFSSSGVLCMLLTLKELRQNQISRRRSCLSQLETRKCCLENKILDFSLLRKYQYGSLNRKICIDDSYSLKRLQDLLFETLGEYKKFCLRVQRCKNNTKSILLIRQDELYEDLHWRYFCTRLEKDARGRVRVYNIKSSRICSSQNIIKSLYW